jgi:tricorn protease
MKIRLSMMLLILITTATHASNGYYRFPALHGDSVVFTAEGDLWRAKIGERKAYRLTTHPAEETHAAISQDGRQVAFSANYEGSTEVYVIAIDGGIAKRVTFENTRTRVLSWTREGKILFNTSSSVGPAGNSTLKQVDPSNLETDFIPLADAVEGSIDDKNKQVYFARFGLQVSTDNVKQYRGGAEGELWKYRLGSTNEAKLLTKEHIGSARKPMVSGDKLYFISDASGNDNIWSMSLDASNFKQHTEYKDWQVRSASLNNQRIIYQLGADLKLLDLKTEKSRLLEFDLTSDFPNLREKWLNKPLTYLTSISQAGELDKVVITARGQVAVASIDGSRLTNVATNPKSRTRNAVLSNDGKWVYAINDASGELEIWRFAADGRKSPKQMTKGGKIFKWNINLSPDGKWIANDDKNGDLWLLNTKTNKNIKILSHNMADSPYQNVTWSSDSRLLAVTRSHKNDSRSRISLIDIGDMNHRVLTTDKYNSSSPAFSPDGKWLYFLSDREFNAFPNSPWGDRNMGPTFDRRSFIYAYSLKRDARFPFQPSNELLNSEKIETNKADEENKDKNKKKKSSDKKSKSVVDWEGIEQRLWQVPVASGNYSGIVVNDEFLYVQDQVNEPGTQPELKSIAIKPNTKLETFTNNIVNFSLSNDGKKIFVMKSGNDNSNLFIVSAGAKFPSDTSEQKVQTKDWQLLINPRDEWSQIFHDAWLMHRDSLFDRNMRGVDWNEVKKKYQPMLDRITDRHELNDIFKQMMGELNALHSQVYGGDVASDKESPKGSALGAILAQSSKGVQIKHIYRHDKELPMQAAPLLRPGVDAMEGDTIIAINGLKTSNIADVQKLLRNQSGKQVLLSLKRNKKTHQTIVIPTTARHDGRLRYNDWVTSTRSKVETADTDIGYLHLYAMGGNDISNFAREFYANYRKGGLIIDVRRNRGGNIDSWIIEKLLRRAWAFWPSFAETNMQQTFRGHLVVLADEYTYSDGETFTAGIKALNIAPVIGKRTAGAGVWLRGQNRLVDNGMARVAEFSQYAMDGRWIIEGHGVEPTIEVDNLPYATYNGKDAQLEAAIAYLKRKMKSEPVKKLIPNSYPKDNGKAGDISL